MNKIICTYCPSKMALVAISAICWYVVPLAAADRNWTGNVSAFWSDPNNWSPAGTPQNGDYLSFGFVDDSHRSMVNDLTALTVQTMSFANNDYQIDGNPLTFNSGAIYNDEDNPTIPNDNSDHTTTINCPLVFVNGGRIYTGGEGGFVTPTTIDLHLNGPITIAQGRLVLEAEATDFNAGGGGNLYVSGVISGGGDVAASSTEIGGHVAQVVFDGTPGNTFSGTLYVSSYYGNSPVIFNKASGFVATNRVAALIGVHGEPARLYLAAPNQIGPNATLEIDAGSQLLLTGNNIGIGSLVLSNFSADANPSTLDSGSTLVGIGNGIIASVNNDHVHPTIKGRLNLVGYAQFNITGGPEPGLEIQAPIGGNGFQKFGAGTLRLNGNNTYSGDVEAIEGTIEADTATAFGQAGPTHGVYLEGGNITLQNVAIGIEPLFVNSTNSLLTAINQCSWSGPVSLGTSLNVVPVDTTFGTRTMDFYGAINGPGGLNLLSAIFGIGGVRLLGSGGNLFTGPTVVGCSLLQLGKPSGVNAYAGPLIVGNPGGLGTCEARWLNSYQNVGATATLYANGKININNYTEDFGPVTFNGGEVDTGTGTFNIYAPLTVNPAATSAVINGYLGLPPGDNRVFIVGDGASDCDLVVNAVIFGSPGTYFVKQGAGTMCLTATNTYNTVTLLEEGIIDINNSSGLGSWAGLVIFDVATLRLSGSGNGNGFEAIGAGVGGTHGAVEVVPNASWNITAGMLLDGPTTFNVGTSSGLGLNAPISSSGPGCSVIKTGPGVLSFGGASANTYSGDTIISAGQCYLSKSANVISVPGNLIIGPGPAGPVTFARLLQIGGIGGDTVSVNANSLFDLNGYNQRLTHVNLRDGGNVATTGGTLSFPAGGNVNVGSLSLFGSHVASTISGFLALPLSGAVTFNVSPAAPTPPLLLGPELEVPAVISGGVNHGNSANLTKEGLGQLRLSGNNTFQGNLFINAGAVIASHPNAMGTTLSGTFVYNGAELIVEGGINVAGEYIDLDSTNSPALESRNGINTIGGVLYLNRNSQVGPSAPADGLVANGQIDGPGSLLKVGLGTMTLGGPSANTYAGETFVNQGTLLLNKPSAVTAIPTALEIGALDGSSAGTVGNLNSYQIVGNILVHPRGTYDVNGQVENVDFLHLYGGGTVRTSGGSLFLNTGGAIYVYPQTNSTATINGSVVLDPGNHLVTVNTGSALPGVNDLVINAAISQSSTPASLQKEGPGRMRLTGINTYTGSTTVNAGVLQVDGAQAQSSVQLNSGTLAGSGTVGPINLNGASAVVAPGSSPGILTCSNFNAGAGGTLQIELNGTTPGTGYDQLNVRGTVNLTGASLSASLGYTSSTNDTFTIINNDGTDPVTGTFTGLPQGKKLYIGQQLFQISYNGGSGNDVVLSRLITPPPPTLTIQRASPNSVRLLWPTNDPPFSLQTASSLPATNWSPAQPLPVVVSTNNVVTNSVGGAEGFYRLSNP